MCPNLCKKREKRKEKRLRDGFSLNSEHLARVPAVLMSWKSTEQVHREGTKGCKQDRGRVPASVCWTASSPCTAGGKLVNWLGLASVAWSETRSNELMADAIRISITASRLPHPGLPLFIPHQWEQE